MTQIEPHIRVGWSCVFAAGMNSFKLYTFLNVGVYSLYVLVKGFRWAVVELAFGYSDFHIEEEKLSGLSAT